MARDPRVDLILRVELTEHMVSYAASKEASGGERWKCRCGKDYRGDGAISKGRRHVARKVLAALDAAAAVA